jgi:4-amino-4-deoxy-L-arabinose transferase-like glycosyltransferase
MSDRAAVPSSTAPRRELALLVLLALVALALRLYRLDGQSLWNDEGTSVALAQRDLVTIAHNAANDIHPPLYYYLLHYWLRLGGAGEAAARSLSALAGAATVLATYALGRRFWGAKTAALGGILAALSPLSIYYAQEARMYALVTLFALLAVWAGDHLRQALDQGAPRAMLKHAALYLLASVAAVYTHYIAFTVLLALNVAVALWWAGQLRTAEGGWQRWKFAAGWLGVHLLLLAAYAPWLAFSWGSLQRWPAVSAPLALSAYLAEVAQRLALGMTVADSSRTLLVALLVALPLLPALGGLGRARGSRWGTFLAALYLLVPLVAMYVLSLQRPMFKPKFALLVSPAYHLLQGAGIAALAAVGGRRWRWAGRILAVLLVLGVSAVSLWSLRNLYADPRFARDDYRGIVAQINATAGAQDAILINAPSQIETVNYYYHGPLPEYPLPLQRPINTAHAEEQLTQIVARHPRLYAILWATDESDPQRFIEGWLDQHCFKASDRWYGNVRLAVYAVPRTTTGEIAQRTDYTLGPSIHLRGYTLLANDIRPGDILPLTLFWETDAPLTERYKVFIHLLGPDGQIVAQRDSEPGGGARLTTLWRPGVVIADNYGLAIPPATPPGEYTLRVGLYRLDGGQRLPVAQGGDAINLTGISLRQ